MVGVVLGVVYDIMSCATGFSDPYCKFKLGRQKRRSTVSTFSPLSTLSTLSPLSPLFLLSSPSPPSVQVVTRCLNPDWKEQFDLRMYEGDNTTLHVEVWDRDLLQSDDFIGE